MPLPSPSLPLFLSPLPSFHTHTHTHAYTHAHTHTKLMALIGEHMSKSHLVNGAVVSRRKKGDRIALWTSKKNKKANLDIWCVQSALVDLLSMNYQLITLSILLSLPLFPSLPPSLPPFTLLPLTPHSKGFIKVLSLACQVEATELPNFIQQLAENQNGLSLVYMHHTDSLRSGTSYQNDARISLREHVDVS